jgi:hypothetical protein
MAVARGYACFEGQSGHREADLGCPLLTHNGHERLRIAAMQTEPEAHFARRKSLM